MEKVWKKIQPTNNFGYFQRGELDGGGKGGDKGDSGQLSFIPETIDLLGRRNNVKSRKTE